MILRIWHGYTTKSNANNYEYLLKTEIFPEIENKKIEGYKRIQLLRRELENEVEFTTIMWFEKLESVRAFVGEDYETVYVPDKARKLLSRFDNKSIHCELIETLDY
jgi:heme-degrading monooxygenase HmoA